MRVAMTDHWKALSSAELLVDVREVLAEAMEYVAHGAERTAIARAHAILADVGHAPPKQRWLPARCPGDETCALSDVPARHMLAFRSAVDPAGEPTDRRPRWRITLAAAIETSDAAADTITAAEAVDQVARALQQPAGVNVIVEPMTTDGAAEDDGAQNVPLCTRAD